MPDQRLVRQPPDPVELARAAVPWLDDDDAAIVGAKDLASAVGLTLISGGGGHFYIGDNATGLALTIGALGLLVVAPMLLPPAVAAVLLLTLLASSAVVAARKVKRLNHFVVLRYQKGAEVAGHPAHKLLHAMQQAGAHSPTAPGASQPDEAPQPAQGERPRPGERSRHDALIDRLRKIIHLRDGQAISALELEERKVDALAAAATGLSRDQLDDLLFELLPLLREGTITDADVEFVKNLEG